MINHVTVGDARELSKAIPDESIDLIFTDPPYPKQYLYLYEWLAEEASRVLKPGGFCLAYAGDIYKYDIMMSMGKHLTYFWDFVSYGYWEGVVIWPRAVLAKNKSILAFCKGEGLPNKRVLSLWVGPGKGDKRFHVWGQEESAVLYYLDAFSMLGDLIYEPFCGGGTVPYVCKQLQRDFIAFEIDPEAASIATKRLETIQPLLFQPTPIMLELF